MPDAPLTPNAERFAPPAGGSQLCDAIPLRPWGVDPHRDDCELAFRTEGGSEPGKGPIPSNGPSPNGPGPNGIPPISPGIISPGPNGPPGPPKPGPPAYNPFVPISDAPIIAAANNHFFAEINMGKILPVFAAISNFKFQIV
jgi:hypothetical protein